MLLTSYEACCFQCFESDSSYWSETINIEIIINRFHAIGIDPFFPISLETLGGFFRLGNRFNKTFSTFLFQRLEWLASCYVVRISALFFKTRKYYEDLQWVPKLYVGLSPLQEKLTVLVLYQSVFPSSLDPVKDKKHKSSKIRIRLYLGIRYNCHRITFRAFEVAIR